VTTCPRAEDLYLYLEEGLGPYDAAKLEEHLDICPACRERMAERRLLHEAFTTLPPFEVPEDFARSVMEKLPEPAEAKGGWVVPLAAATASLVVGLLGFYLLTGQSLSDLLVAFNRTLGSAIAASLPLGVKLFKIVNLLLKVAFDLVSEAGAAIGTVARFLGPQGIALMLGLGGLLAVVAFCGARRLLSLGEKT
jgi:predicted anti-sigma-YlaC factor YlaD